MYIHWAYITIHNYNRDNRKGKAQMRKVVQHGSRGLGTLALGGRKINRYC